MAYTVERLHIHQAYILYLHWNGTMSCNNSSLQWEVCIHTVYVYTFPFFPSFWPLRAQPKRGVLSQTMPGCVTCYTCHASVMDFRPILGNPVEVAHMTSPGLYITSHAYFPLARISSLTPPFNLLRQPSGPGDWGDSPMAEPNSASP